MPALYREFLPLPSHSPRVESFWISGSDSSAADFHRVYPDGCIDILYMRSEGRSRLDVVGTMTRYQDFLAPPGCLLIGVRFRPGGLHGLGVPPCTALTDTATEYAAIQPREAVILKRRLDDAMTPAAFEAALAPLLSRAPEQDGMARALSLLEASHGQADLTSLVRQTGCSERQFRRLCLARTGLAPKQLSKVLRFRHAMSRIGTVRLTDLAVDCGYYDQAHFIHDFRNWTGKSPSEIKSGRMSDSYNRGPAVFL